MKLRRIRKRPNGRMYGGRAIRVRLLSEIAAHLARINARFGA